MSDLHQVDNAPDKSRRRFMLFVPIAAIGGIFVTVGKHYSSLW